MPSPLRQVPSAVSTPRVSTSGRVAAAGAALLLAGTLAACSGGDSGGAPSAPLPDKGSSGGAAPSGYRAAADSGGGGTASPPASPQTAARVLPGDRDVVYRGSISVQVTDVGEAVGRAEDLATGADGVVFAEQTSVDPRHPRHGSAELTLRVPPTAFGPTLDALGRLGKELDRQRSAEDVTMQVTDTASRVQSQRRSVERMRVLLARATTIGQVVQVESELARREADLESLEAQLARLKDLTDLATIQVHLSSPDRPPAPPRHEDHLGFLSGLRGGWDAFVGIVVVALTVVGALVPFAVTAALVGIPLLLVWRSRHRRPAPTPRNAADA